MVPLDLLIRFNRPGIAHESNLTFAFGTTQKKIQRNKNTKYSNRSRNNPALPYKN